MDDALSIPAGTELAAGHYRVLRPIGRSPEAVVYEAEQLPTRKRVALKCLYPGLDRGAALASLTREARAHARVGHASLVDVYDIVDDGARAFLVMELLEGESFGAWLTRGRRELHVRLGRLLPVLQAVACAHASGVAHLRLELGRIFLTRVTREGDSETARSKVLGWRAASIDAAAAEKLYDVYACGVLLFEALSAGVVGAADAVRLLASRGQAREAPPELRSLRPDVPRSLDRLIAWALAVEPAARLQSVAELLRELEPFSTAYGMSRESRASES